MSWVLGHLDDLASDLSAIHGIRDMTQLSGAAFFKLAFRMTAYQSVMRERAAALMNDEQQPAGRAAPGYDGSATAPFQPGRQEVPATKAAIQADPVMAGLISFGSPAPKASAPDLREAAMREYPELRPPMQQT